MLKCYEAPHSGEEAGSQMDQMIEYVTQEKENELRKNLHCDQLTWEGVQTKM